MKPSTILFIIACCCSLPAGAAESLCAQDEAVIFACNTGNKLASVCASRNLSATAGYLQYRFGPKGAPELVYPEAKTHPGPDIQARTLVFAGGGGAYVRFKHGPYGYVVYSAEGRGWGEKTGVTVEKNGKPTTNLRCKGAVTSELGPDFFTKAGLAEAPDTFELP